VSAAAAVATDAPPTSAAAVCSAGAAASAPTGRAAPVAGPPGRGRGGQGPTALPSTLAATFAAAVPLAEASCPTGGPSRLPPCSPFTTAVGGVATHTEHLRVLADLFFWLLLNWPGANSAKHPEHRMAARVTPDRLQGSRLPSN
jgi:hypothetical protein